MQTKKLKSKFVFWIIFYIVLGIAGAVILCDYYVPIDYLSSLNNDNLHVWVGIIANLILSPFLVICAIVSLILLLYKKESIKKHLFVICYAIIVVNKLFIPDSKLLPPNLQHALGFRDRLRNEISSDDVKTVQKRLLTIDYDKYLAEVDRKGWDPSRRSEMRRPHGIPKFGAKRVHINIHKNPYYADAHFKNDRSPFELVIGQPDIKIPEPYAHVYYLPLYDGAYIECEGMKVNEDWDINKYK